MHARERRNQQTKRTKHDGNELELVLGLLDQLLGLAAPDRLLDLLIVGALLDDRHAVLDDFLGVDAVAGLGAGTGGGGDKCYGEQMGRE